MRLEAITIGATLASGAAASSHRHGHHHPIRRHYEAGILPPTQMDTRDSSNNNNDSRPALEKRKKKCAFPSNKGLVSVTPGASNGGWALSPDQECTAGTYCPFACPPGKVMSQWKPGSSYTYPSSMDGGLYCNDDGEVEKPFSNSDYCVDGTGTVSVENKAGKPLSFCQTVLPGNEAMLIPTVVDSSATLAVPDSNYWCGTSSHFYINPPGVGSEGCIWGTDSEPIGNWTPYVAGANTVSGGETFLKIGWNNEWLQSGLKNTLPTYGLEIKCNGSGCNGLPCSITPGKDGVNGINAPSSGETASTGSFCVVTIPKGKSASIVVTSSSGSSSSSSSSSGSSSPGKPVISSTSSQQPQSQQQTAPPLEQHGTFESTTNQPQTTLTIDDDKLSDPKTSSSSPTSTKKQNGVSIAAAPTTISSSKVLETSSTKDAESTGSSSNAEKEQYDGGREKGAVFIEQDENPTDETSATANSNATPSSESAKSAETTGTFAAAAPADTLRDEAVTHQGGAVASLVIALVVGLYLF